MDNDDYVRMRLAIDLALEGKWKRMDGVADGANVVQVDDQIGSVVKSGCLLVQVSHKARTSIPSERAGNVGEVGGHEEPPAQCF